MKHTLQSYVRERELADIREHLRWIEAHGSLHKAVHSNERDFTDSPIERWYKAHCAELALRRARTHNEREHH